MNLGKTTLLNVLALSMLSAIVACSSDDDGGGGASGDATSALGTACSTSAECGNGLSCHRDSSDYIAHGQCATDCSSTAECVDAFGDSSMCIGAGICVRTCETDSDCPDLTKCGNAGWCERSGAASGNPYCSGSPTPCSLLDEFDCIAMLGCNWSGGCSGVAPSCYSQGSSYACNAVDGCNWSSYSDSCSGSATSCSLQSSSYSCTSQTGCHWSGSCMGLPMDNCEDQFVSTCSYVDGCHVVYPE